MTDLRGEREAMKKNTKTRRSMTVVLTAQALAGVTGGDNGVIQMHGINGGGVPSGVTVNALNSYLD
jgi:hypothetical protein